MPCRISHSSEKFHLPRVNTHTQYTYTNPAIRYILVVELATMKNGVHNPHENRNIHTPERIFYNFMKEEKHLSHVSQL